MRKTIYILFAILGMSLFAGCDDDNKSPEAHMAMKARMKGGPRYTITSLQVMVKAVERGMYPTPNATDWKNRGSAEYRKGQQVQLQTVAGGQLNPMWVEWLMGFPIGWTDLGV